MQYGGWNRSGFAYYHQAALTNLAQRFLVGTDATNQARSHAAPRVHMLQSIEVHLDTIAGGGATLTLAVYRDSGGDVALVQPLAAIAITAGATTGTDGTVVYNFDPFVVHHFLQGVSTANGTGEDEQDVRIWVSAHLNAGTANANIVYNWIG